MWVDGQSCLPRPFSLVSQPRSSPCSFPYSVHRRCDMARSDSTAEGWPFGCRRLLGKAAQPHGCARGSGHHEAGLQWGGAQAPAAASSASRKKRKHQANTKKKHGVLSSLFAQPCIEYPQARGLSGPISMFQQGFGVAAGRVTHSVCMPSSTHAVPAAMSLLGFPARRRAVCTRCVHSLHRR